MLLRTASCLLPQFIKVVEGGTVTAGGQWSRCVKRASRSHVDLPRFTVTQDPFLQRITQPQVHHNHHYHHPFTIARMYSSGLQVTPRQPLQATMSLCALPSTAFRESYVRFYSSRPPPVPSSSLDENQNETKPLTSKEEEKGKAEAVKRQQASLDTKAEEKLSIVQKFKLMYKQYWYVLIPVHIVTSVVWYGSFYIAAKSGVDIIPLMEKLGAGEKILSHLQSSNAGYYAIAYAMYKIATPARYTVTVGGTTISINYLKKRGYIKPVPSSEQLKEMYEGKKEELIEKKEEIVEKYQEKKEEIVDRYQEKKDEFIDRYQEKKEEIIDRYQEQKERYQETRDEMVMKVSEKKEELRERVADKTEEIKGMLEKKNSRLTRVRRHTKRKKR